MSQYTFYDKNKEVHIDINNEMLAGDVLDVGASNYGIIYNLYKHQNKDLSIEYIHGKEEKSSIEKKSYDNCILFFSLGSMWLKKERKELLKDINTYLKQDGILHLWDVDKGYWRFFNNKIKVLVPESSSKNIPITDLNIFKDTSLKSTAKLLSPYFEIIDLHSLDKVYYIKAKKRALVADVYEELSAEMKGSTKVENYFSGNKFKIRTQQFGSKIFEGLYKRIKL
jgi:hypothetical protein